MHHQYSITYLLREHFVLLVGGGRVATRKINAILAVHPQMTIHVVAPEFSQTLRKLAQNAHLTLIERAFEPTDIIGAGLVFAATDHPEVNKRVIEAAQAQNVLVCCVDSQWQLGDFITPATTRVNDISVAISTGGTACRRARLIKQWASRHLQYATRPQFMVVGTDHNRTPLEEREKIQLNEVSRARILNQINLLSPIHEFMLLNTCNRFELYFVAPPNDTLKNLIPQILKLDTLDNTQYYAYEGDDAFRHFCKVTAGLYSQTPGENYITAQVKETLDYAVKNKYANRILQDITELTLHAARQIRNAVSSELKCTEIEDLVVKYIHTHAPKKKERTILVLGSGTIGNALIARLNTQKDRVTQLYYSTQPQHADKLNVHIAPLSKRDEYLPNADVVITALDSPNAVITCDLPSGLIPTQNALWIDLSIPRNIEPDIVKKHPQIRLINLDDLKHWYRREVCDMNKVFQIVDDTLLHEMETFNKIQISMQQAIESFIH